MQETNDTMTTSTTPRAPHTPKAESRMSPIGFSTRPETTAPMSGKARIIARQTKSDAAMPT